MLPEIMKAQGRDSSGLSQTPPCGTPAFLRSRGIESPILTCGEHVVIRLCAPYHRSKLNADFSPAFLL